MNRVWLRPHGNGSGLGIAHASRSPAIWRAPDALCAAIDPGAGWAAPTVPFDAANRREDGGGISRGESSLVARTRSTRGDCAVGNRYPISVPFPRLRAAMFGSCEALARAVIGGRPG
jgi:hypothetical protein